MRLDDVAVAPGRLDNVARIWLTRIMTTKQITGNLVQVALDNNGDDVTNPQIAAEMVEALMGTAREVEYSGFPGCWLVAFTDDELAELRMNEYFGRNTDIWSLEAEWV